MGTIKQNTKLLELTGNFALTSLLLDMTHRVLYHQR